MRKITQQAINAFMNGEKFSSGNTTVVLDKYLVFLSLHGNEIARRNAITGKLEISNAGWFSVVTKERLNGIPGVRIYQKRGVWFLNNKPWDGGWITI